MGRVIATAVTALAGAAVAPGVAQAQAPPTESASGSVVEVTGGGTETTTVGGTTSTVTTGTSDQPATSDVVLIEEGGTTAGETSSGTSGQTQTDSTASTDSAKVVGADGTVTTASPETTTAGTAANVEIGTGRVVAAEGRRRVEIRVRGARSRSRAVRRGRHMETSASAGLGDGQGAGLSVSGLVTVGELRASSQSEAGRRVGNRIRLRVRHLRIRAAKGEKAVIHVHRARMLDNGRLRARVTLRMPDGRLVTDSITIRRSRHGRNLLARSTYRDSARLTRAFRRLERRRLEEVEERVQVVRIGGSLVERGKRRTTARVEGLTIVLTADPARSGAGATGLPSISTVVGAVTSAATTAATPIVTAAEGAVEVSESIAGVASDIPGALSDLPAVILGRSFSIRSSVVRLSSRKLELALTCASDFAGDLFLMDPEDEDKSYGSSHVTCRVGGRLTVSFVIDEEFSKLIDLPRGFEILPEVDLDGTTDVLRLSAVTLRAP